MKQGSKYTVAVIAGGVLIVFVGGPYLAYRTWNKVERCFREKRRSLQFRYGRLPKSQPISQGVVKVAGHRSSISPTSILSLPIEIRQQIYELVLHTKNIYQPCPGRRRYPLYKYHGPQPPDWPPHQHTRSEDDPPSQALGIILRLGGSCFRPSPAPKRQGCVGYFCVSLLICGEMDMDLKPAVAAETCFLTDLMRSNRMIYGDMLHHFYARNLFSFFGPEMLLYFVRNVNPEGLRLIRYVHLAIPLQSEGWESKESQALVTKAFEVLQGRFESVKQLDVEVVILRSQPADPQLLAAWLRDEIFGQLHGLEKLIVKVSVHKGLAVHEERSDPYGPPVMEALSSWTEPLYKTVKDAATSGPKE
ncbi:hypothetical protein Daus18300_010783 [Diaporthe australafricana]|uniref:Uncharacterized protein n=1 Tax=Diaporthe australafricana TaxID=127596 RepID=A0ABR3W9U4_9PEZI